MSVLLKLAGALEQITDDYLRLDDDTPAPPTDKSGLIVSLRRWQEAHSQLSETGLTVAVSIPNTAPLFDISQTILARPMLVLSFPMFSDGRALSQAQILRLKYHYKGVLRAEGALLQDQIPALLRCGFDQLLLPAMFTGLDAGASTDLSRIRYQPDVQQAFDLRLKRR